METREQRPDKKVGGPTDHLANERTFLAWIRTSIALMGFGFVLVKFAVFIRQTSLILTDRTGVPEGGSSAVVGVVMVALGAVIAILAFLRYRSIERQLHNHEYFPSKRLSVLLTLAILIGSILLVIYLLPSI